MYPREEPLAENLFFVLRNLGKGFVGKYGSFTVSYETVTGFVQNQLLLGFIAKSLRVSSQMKPARLDPVRRKKFRSDPVGKLTDSLRSDSDWQIRRESQ